ncbi:MAG: hypothetical protein WAT79_13275 [Saprospiraceae bacterium]
MHGYFKISKILHWSILLCFFLPFFRYEGCGSSQTEVYPETPLYENSIDTTIPNDDKTTEEYKESDAIDTFGIINDSSSNVNIQESQKVKNHDKLSEKLSFDYPFLKPILNPKPNYYSGIGLLLDSYLFLIYGSLFLSFLLLLLSLCIKYFEKISLKTIVLLDTLSLITFYCSYPFTIGPVEKLWGYWFCFVLILIMTIYDFLMLKNSKKY